VHACTRTLFGIYSALALVALTLPGAAALLALGHEPSEGEQLAREPSTRRRVYCQRQFGVQGHLFCLMLSRLYAVVRGCQSWSLSALVRDAPLIALRMRASPCSLLPSSLAGCARC
jgi:hypothetical protein